jgi:hypothetical protein
VQRLGADPHVAEVFGLGRAVAQREAAQAQDRAGSADHAIEPRGGNLIEERAHLAIQVLGQPAGVMIGKRVGSDEALCQPDDPCLEALAARQVGRGPERDLDAPAADVDDNSRGAADVHAVAGGQMDEPGLFRSGNDPDAYPCLPRHFGDEISAVLRFPGGARSRGDDLINLVRFGKPPEFGQGLESCRHGRRRQAPSIEPSRPQSDHVFFTVHHLE